MSAPRRHPVFSRFRFTAPASDGVVSRNAIGALERVAYYATVMEHHEGFQPPPAAPSGGFEPPLDEEYFEWIDLLGAVERYAAAPGARPFTFAEIGAGYGRWAANAIHALRQLAPDADFRVVAVEADGEHFAWLRQNLVDNGIPPERSRLYEAPVAGGRAEVMFHGGDPHNWYGQSILDERTVSLLERKPRAQRIGNAYVGELGIVQGWLDRWLGPKVKRRVKRMRAMGMAQVLEGIEAVDLMDMDIQGAEADVIEHGADVLADKVMVLHVGTHSPEVEERLRRCLGARGWALERDYGCNGVRETPFGPIAFVDGVQTWRNAKLA